MGSVERSIFRRGSKTFFFSSLFFPRSVRRDVFALYSFVRVADDYVDEFPFDSKSFFELKKMWQVSKKNEHYDVRFSKKDDTNERVIKNIVRLKNKHTFKTAWVDDFIKSMEFDLNWKSWDHSQKHTKKVVHRFKNQKSLLLYMHGSSEVVGLMMAKIMNLPAAAWPVAALQGRTLQLVNFIRDVKEDNNLGRCYFNLSILRKHNLSDLSYLSAKQNPEGFDLFIQHHVQQYRLWQEEALKGFKYIPKRYRIPVKTAVDLYAWTIEQIAKKPMIVYEKKVKPSRYRILKTALNNIFIA